MVVKGERDILAFASSVKIMQEYSVVGRSIIHLNKTAGKSKERKTKKRMKRGKKRPPSLTIDLTDGKDSKGDVKVVKIKKTKKKKTVPKDPLNARWWKSGHFDTITGVDPAPRNFSPYKYSVSRGQAVAWDWVDFQGVNRSKKTANQVVQQLDYYIDDHPEFFDQADLIVVETQIVIAAKNIRIQKRLMERFPKKCIEADPKTVKAMMEMWTSMPTGQYALKKKTTVELGMHIMTKHERELLDIIKRGRKTLSATVKAHDTKLIKQGRTKAKKPRRVKTQPADAFDAMMVALCTACELLGRDLVRERLEKKEEIRKRGTLDVFLNVDSVENNYGIVIM